MIFEALTCDIPYRSENIEVFDLSAHIASGRRPVLPMGVVTYDVEALVKLYNRCTELLPKSRPTAKELVRELSKLMEGPPPTFTPR